MPAKKKCDTVGLKRGFASKVKSVEKDCHKTASCGMSCKNKPLTPRQALMKEAFCVLKEARPAGLKLSGAQLLQRAAAYVRIKQECSKDLTAEQIKQIFNAEYKPIAKRGSKKTAK